MQDKLRIGIILTTNYTPESGGGFGYYESLVKAIDEYHFDPLIEFVFIQMNEETSLEFKREFLHYKFDKETADIKRCKRRIEQVNTLPFKTISRWLRKRYEARIPLLTKKRIEEEKRDFEGWVVHQKIDLLYYVTPGGGDYNIPFVTTHWDVGHYSTYAFPEVAMSGGYEWRERFYDKIHKKALAVFCESETGKAELIQYKQLNPNRIFVVPLFPGKIVDLQIDPTEQQLLIGREFGLSKQKYFLYPAQFWAHKNHYHLLLAFKKVVVFYPDFKLILSGSDKGNLQYVKELIASLHLKDAVITPGFITNEALFCLYKNAVALVMPTFLGPTNMPLLEAAFLDCPVITTDLVGHREILGHYATYINPADEDSIAKAMLDEIVKGGGGNKKFENDTNKIGNAIAQIENSFLEIRKVRKTWGLTF